MPLYEELVGVKTALAVNGSSSAGEAAAESAESAGSVVQMTFAAALVVCLAPIAL